MDTEKAELIKKIYKLSDFYDSVAESTAMDAIRFPNDEARMEKARDYVSLADDRKKMAKDIADIIHAYWPK